MNTPTFALSARSDGSAGSVALVRIARLNLCLPQSDIVAVEARASVDTAGPGARSVGWVTHQQHRWPVYCLSEDLSLLFQVPAGRRACVLLAGTNGSLGVLCDEIRISPEGSGPTHAIPDAMRLPETPLLGVQAMESGIACFSDGSRLVAYVQRMVTR